MNTNDTDNGTDNGAANVPTTTDTTTTTGKPARVRKPPVTRTRAPKTVVVPVVNIKNVRTFADVLAVATTITPDNFGRMLATVNASNTVGHNARNVGRFTGGRVMDMQNIMMRDNRTLDDLQILFAWCCDFPMAVGKLWAANREPGSVSAIVGGIGIVRGVRAEYNRPGGTNPHHGAKFPVTVPSVRYGPDKFAFTVATATIPASR